MGDEPSEAAIETANFIEINLIRNALRNVKLLDGLDAHTIEILADCAHGGIRTPPKFDAAAATVIVAAVGRQSHT